MADADLERLVAFAKDQNEGPVAVLNAIARRDVNLDHEELTRLTLLLEEPRGDTWDLDDLDVLKHAIQREALRLGLPWVSLTLVARSEAAAIDEFSRA